MLRKLWCLLFGHKIRERVYTGDTYITNFGIGHYYKWKYSFHCLRCNIKMEDK